MGKGIKALSYLPKIDIFNEAGPPPCSIRAYRAVLYEVQQLQANEIQNGELAAEVLLDSQPYYNSTWNIGIDGAVEATGTVTIVSPSEDETVTINGLTYTGVIDPKVNNTQFDVSAGSDTLVAADLVDSVTNDTRVGNSPFDVTAANVAGVVTFTASETGLDGNLITLSSSSVGELAVSGPLLTGGLNPDVFEVAFVSETNPEIESINTPGLTTKRPLEIIFETGDTNPFTVRSIISVLNWIEDWAEVRVSSTGSDDSTDATYTDAIFKGATPYLTYIWTVVKLGNVYTLTSTADS